MWTMGSPFDAPHPRFQQAAAHLSSSIGPNAKKPPLSPSLPIDGERSLQERSQTLPKGVAAEFASSPSLEHSGSLSNISRRRISASSRGEFSSAHSLPFVQEFAEAASSASGDAALQMPSCSSSEPLQAQSSLPALPPVSSLLLPQPAGCRWLPRNLPSLLAATGMLALLVMSVVILWPSSGRSATSLQPLQQPPSINLPRKFFDRIFNGNQPQQMEHFTPAQGAGWGTGFGLEDSSQPSMEVIPSDDFTKFVSAHLGWEDEEPVSDAVAEARFEVAEAINDHLPRAGGFGEGLVTIDAKGVDHMAHAISAAVTASAKTGAAASSGNAASSAEVAIEGRKELETGGTAATGAATTAAKPAAASSTGVIPQETIRSGDPLSNSIGVADPMNLLDSDTTAPVTTNSNGGATKPRIAVQPGVMGGTNGNQQMTGAFAAASSAGTGKSTVAVQPTISGGTNGNSQMSGGTSTAAGSMGGTQVVGTRQTSSSAAATSSSGSKTTASALRSSNSGRASGNGATSRTAGAGTGAVGSNQPLESVAAGQVATVAQSDLSGSSSSAGGTFKPLAG